MGDANGAADSGQAYVLFGRAEPPFPAVVELSDLDGSNGFAINGLPEAGSSLGSAIAAGDFDGDGFSDVALGAPAADAGGNSRGQVFVLWGHDPPFPAVVNASDGFVLSGDPIWTELAAPWPCQETTTMTVWRTC